jgi:hypothetical protein
MGAAAGENVMHRNSREVDAESLCLYLLRSLQLRETEYFHSNSVSHATSSIS